MSPYDRTVKAQRTLSGQHLHAMNGAITKEKRREAKHYEDWVELF